MHPGGEVATGGTNGGYNGDGRNDGDDNGNEGSSSAVMDESLFYILVKF